MGKKAKKKTPKKTTLFISRPLDKKSPFQKLRKKGVKITDRSFIKFKELPFSKPPFHSAVFFYSARGIVTYLTKKPYKKKLMYGVMGTASNQVFKSLTGKDADLIGTSDISVLAKQINRRWTGYTVLFPKAKKSLDSLAKQKLKINPIHLEVYDNKVNKKLRVPKCDMLIFTSPLNFLGYIKHHSLKGKRIYAIGATTATIIQGVTGKLPIFPKQPSEAALYELVKADLKKATKKQKK